jgi:DNA-directed RNA polymerase specialized sigma24 family protein
MTVEETAAALGVSNSTAKRLISRASTAVAAKLAADPGLRELARAEANGGGR